MLKASMFSDKLYYTRKDGFLRWKTIRYRSKVGSIAGGKNKGYIKLYLKHKFYFAHRIVWALVYGKIHSKEFIDHKNGNGFDNRLSNLRIVSLTENQRNSKVHRYGRPVGVRVHNSGKWQAYIKTNSGATKYIGLFKTQKIAAEAIKRYDQ